MVGPLPHSSVQGHGEDLVMWEWIGTLSILGNVLLLAAWLTCRSDLKCEVERSNGFWSRYQKSQTALLQLKNRIKELNDLSS